MVTKTTRRRAPATPPPEPEPERDPLESWDDDPEGTKPIVVGGKRVLTLTPTPEQLTVMVRLAHFEANTRGDARRQAAMINRTPMLIQALCFNDDDWFDIEDRLVLPPTHPDFLEWEVVTTMLADILKAHADEGANRQQRRANARTARRVAD